jgi:hypothetical protein
MLIEGFLTERVFMNDTTITLIAVGIGAVLAVGFFLYNAIRGVQGSLASAKVGEIFNFEYEQPYHGEPERILARVIEPVYSLDEGSIRRLNARSAYRRNDPNFKRTKHLVTCEMADGSVRNFYAERTKNVRRLPIGHPLFRAAAALIL